MVLAGFGAAGLVQDELAGLAGRLITRGETAEGDTRQRIEALIDERQEQVRKLARRAESDFNKRMGQVLNRANVPSRAEISALNTKITRLTKKVDELNKTAA